MFHYIFPPLTIGLGLFMVVVECLYIKTKDPLYKDMALFWTKIFAANFAVGVATGIVMEFEFGTNWATYSRYVGDVFGSALFSTTYSFLFAVWVYVINNKIQHGPEGLAAQVQAFEYAGIDKNGKEIESGDSFFEVASRMFKHGEYSLTETKSLSLEPPADSASA